MTLRTLGERCGWARKRLGYTQGQLAKLAGVSGSVIANPEAGRGGPKATMRKVTEVAAVLKVDPHWLATGEGSPDPAAASPVLIACPMVSDDEADMISAWLTAWRGADAAHRSLIESAFAVAASSAAPAQRVA
jgi:transcriptional regulator with XRE-family HTH domain